MIYCHIFLMLNIINSLKKNHIVKNLKNKQDTINIHKRNIPFNKEWYNSIYSFNKNPIRFMPAVHEFVFKLLNMHFNMYNKDLETRDKSREHRKIKRSLLNNKIWVSSPEIKHFNTKAIITFYVYNRLYNQCKKQLNLLGFTWGPVVEDSIIDNIKSTNKFVPIRVTKKIEILKNKNPTYLTTNKAVHYKSKNFYLKAIKWLKLDKLGKTEYRTTDLLNNLSLKKFDRHSYLINILKKELIYLRLKQKMLFNKFKFNEVYLTLLINWLQAIYKKKIEFNVVMLKHHYLSSSILAQMATAKVIDKKNRGNASKPIASIIENNYIPNLSGKSVQREKKMAVGIQNVIYNQLKEDNKYDSLNRFLITNNKSKMWSSTYIDNFAMQNIENKSVAGIFIKISGRLTKRYKAQRSMSILKHRGTLKNVYSAHKGYSSVLSRGYSNINIDKTVIHSKLRIGAFGLTGWVSSS